MKEKIINFLKTIKQWVLSFLLGALVAFLFAWFWVYSGLQNQIKELEAKLAVSQQNISQIVAFLNSRLVPPQVAQPETPAVPNE